MNLGFWGELRKLKPFTVLAPMANVTDWAFRKIVAECGKPDIFYTEFVSADGILAVGVDKFKGELFFEEDERPIVAQFFTSKPDNIEKMAELAQKLGFDGIDINMGCPDRSIEKQGAGAALIKNPELAKKIIKSAIKGAGRLSVSVKTRLGYNKIETDTWICNLLDTEIASLAIHARTRKEMSLAPAHWEELGKISELAKKTDKIIVGNGDVSSFSDIEEKADKFGLDGIMVGRGIFNNLSIFSKLPAALTPRERINLLLKHLDNFERLWGGNKKFDTLKRFFKIYISDWDGARDLRSNLMDSRNIAQARTILKSNF